MKVYTLNNSTKTYIANTTVKIEKQTDPYSGKHFTSTLADLNRLHKSNVRTQRIRII